jgi:peptidoglycan L-alanyl-D-glutamate endopeptidase CwlK
MSRSILDLDPDVQRMAEELRRRCAIELIAIQITQTYRTGAEQAALYAIGRTVAGMPCHHRGELGLRPLGTCAKHPLGRTVTNAPPGYSWHEFKRAFDIAEADKTPYDIGAAGEDDVDEVWWNRVGDIGEECGLAWGGRWKNPDRPHFEHTGGFTLAYMRARAAEKESKA